MQRVNSLVQTIHKMAAGDLTARTEAMDRRSELSEVAIAFDSLGEALQAQRTETESALEALRASEAKFRTLTETSATATFIVQDGQFRYSSPAWTAITGYAEAELLRMRFVDLIHPESVDRVTEQKHAMLDGEQVSPRVKFKILTRNRAARWIDFTAGKTQYEGRPAMMGTALDITDQEQAAADLISSEDRYRRLVELSPDAIYIYIDRKLAFINPAGVRLFGAARPEQLLGKDLLELVHPDYHDIASQRVNQIIEQGLDAPRIEEKIIRVDGTSIDVEVASSPFILEGKCAAQVIARDITERKKAEETRLRREQELEALYQTSLEINAQLELRKLLNAIVERATGLLGASKGGLYLARPDGETLELLVSHNLPGVFVGAVIHPGEGVAGKVLQMGEPVTVENYEGWPGRVDLFASVAFGRVLGVPLRIGNRVIGVISITDNQRTGPFSENEIRLVSLFADQAAIAVEKTRLYETVQRELSERERSERIARRLVDELTCLHAVALAGNEAANLDDLIERVTAIIGEKFFPDDFGIGFVDEARGGLYFHPSYRIQEGSTLPFIPLGEGVTGRVAKTARPWRVVDVTREAEYRAADPRILSELCVPILLGERVLGVINAESAQAGAFSDADERLLTALAGELGTAIEKFRLLEAERQRRQEAETLRELTASLTSTLDLDQVLKSILTYLERVVPYDSTSITLLSGDRLEITAQRGFQSEEQTRAVLHIDDLLHMREVAERARPVIIPDTSRDPRWRLFPGSTYIHCWLGVPLVVKDHVIGLINLDKQEAGFYSQEHADLAMAFANQAAAAIENARLFEAEKQRSQELAELAKVSGALRLAQDRATMVPIILEQVVTLLRVRGAALLLLDPANEQLCVELGHGVWQNTTGTHMSLVDNPVFAAVIESGNTYQNDSAGEDPRLSRHAWIDRTPAVVCVPLTSQDQKIGILCLGNDKPVTEMDLRLLTAIADIAASALHRTTLHDQTVKQVQQLSILRAVDTAIATSFDARFTLNILLEETINGLNLDAADVLRFNPSSHSLEVAAVKGIRNPLLSHPRGNLRVFNSLDRRLPQTSAMLERRPVIVPDLSQLNDERARLLAQEGFVSAVIAPFVAKGQVKGMMEIFFRSAANLDREWMDFIEALAGQAAIALDNVELFENLEHSNLELSLAYDATIEGWSQALDQRDKETEGHTLRVAAKANELAQKMGIGGSQLVHIRRGALLHDIGKIGVPDRILLKEDSLSEEEWVTMRRHPVLAYELLSPIAFLRHAIDIPYCHHEKWDGTGYPRGLKGEEIPLTARIFAIIDVWDALLSDRPYRKAWPEEKVREYLREQSGKHFDPQVAEAFFQLMGWKE